MKVEQPWAVVANTSAGRQSRRWWQRLQHRAEERGATTVAMVEDMDAFRRAVGSALDRGHDVVACGGDGTVAVAAGMVAEAGATLAVVPAGTGNDLARHLRLTRDPLGGLDVIGDSHRLAIDLGRVHCETSRCSVSRWFTTVAHVGFDSAAAQWARDHRFPRGASRYLVAALRTLATYSPAPFRVTIDGHTTSSTNWLVAVANAPYYGGGMRIAPAASVRDGLLDVCLVGDLSRPSFVRTLPSVFSGRHVDHPAIGNHVARMVEVDTAEVPAPAAPHLVYANGEMVGSLPMRTEVVPGALHVALPPDSRLGRAEGVL